MVSFPGLMNSPSPYWLIGDSSKSGSVCLSWRDASGCHLLLDVTHDSLSWNACALNGGVFPDELSNLRILCLIESPPVTRTGFRLDRDFF